MAVLDFMQKHHLTRIGIETNGIGNALPEILRDIANKKQRNIGITQISNHINKETRILNALEPLLSTGHLYMHDGIKQTMLLSEMLAFTPIGPKEHDDGLDALAGAISMMPIPTRTINKPTIQIRANTDFKI
jgi:predicted phage terminase large subunit-like protein